MNHIRPNRERWL